MRLRLVVGLMVVVTAGLGAVDVATWSALKAFLVQRVDSQLEATRRPVDAQIAAAGGLVQLAADPQMVRRVVPAGTYLQLRGPTGRVLVTAAITDAQGATTSPALPTPLPPPGRRRAASVAETVGSDPPGGGRFRVKYFTARFGTTAALALPLKPVQETLSRLVVASLVASIVTLVAVLALVLVVVRLGLRPLDAMTDTAAAIAEGDLTRRVRGVDGRTEAGRLGLALNAMLGQIEVAFANRQTSEERLRRFVSDASHELRTPLTSIRGYAELFRSGASERPDDLAKAMGRIESEATRMGALIDDLLLLARLDQGRELDLREVDLSELAADAVDDARAGAPGYAVSLDAPTPVVVEADAHQIRQVLANLVTNARTHTPPGTAVTVRVRAEDTASPVGVIEVHDEGPGLTEEQSERVWDRFWRADRAPASGSGLGLSIVAAIAHAHGGRATVRSRPGSGTTFRVEVPRRRAGAPGAGA